jgi:C_GCAxxG_C_C family probable redox protein
METREERMEKVKELHRSGYNCAQIVVTWYCEQLGADKNTAFQMAEAFGLGTGDMSGICGAVSGALMLAGLKNSGGIPIQGKRTVPGTFQLGKEIKEAFAARNSSIICRELKGADTGKILRSCDDCILDAIELAGRILELEN